MAFPTTGVLESGTGANEDPIATRWDESQPFIAGDPGRLAKISNNITNASGGGTDTSSAYDAASFSGIVEVWATITTASAVAADQFRLVMRTAIASNPAADGYELHVEKSAVTDIWRLRRRDNVTPTTLGADM